MGQTHLTVPLPLCQGLGNLFVRMRIAGCYVTRMSSPNVLQAADNPPEFFVIPSFLSGTTIGTQITLGIYMIPLVTKGWN